jgi:hypothetical protein
MQIARRDKPAIAPGDKPPPDFVCAADSVAGAEEVDEALPLYGALI